MPAGSGSLGLLFKIIVDSKDAQTDLKEIEKKLEGTGGASQNLASELENLSKKVLGMSGAGGEATSAITQLSTAIGGMAGVITITAVAALAALAAGLAACVKEAISLGSELHDMSQITGLSVENLSALRLAAITSGSSLEELTQGFVRFERAASDGGEKAVKALEDFGLSAADVTRDPEAAFDAFLKKFNEIGPSAERTADTMALFGRGGARLIPTFLELGDGLEGARKKAEELGIAFSPDMANKADEVGDKLDALHLQLQAVFVKIGVDLLPQISKLADELIGLAKILGPIVEDLAGTVAFFVQINGVMPQVIGGFSALRSVLKAIRDEAGKKGLLPDINLPDLPEVKTSRFASGVHKMVDALGKLAGLKDPIGALKQVTDHVADVPPGVDEKALLDRATKGGGFAIKAIEKALADQREKAAKAETLASLGLLKEPKEKKPKKAKDETFEAETEDARARLDAVKRTAAEEQALFKSDLDAKIINQDQFADFMKASEASIAEAHVKAVLEQREIDLKSAKTPDDRAAIERRTANEIANIRSELVVKLIKLEDQRVKANEAADEKLIEDAIKLDEKERKLTDERNAFRIKSEIETRKAIADAIDSEDVKSPHEVDMGVGVIADIHATVDALDPATKAWREATFAIDGYNQALQQGKLSFADFPQIVEQIINGLIDMTIQLAMAGQGWEALKLAIKTIPLIFLDQFVKQVKKMTDAFIETGKTGPAALKQLVAGTIKAVAQMASTWAMYMFEYAIAMLAIQDYKSAALAFAAGVGLEAVAIALGFVANKISKGSESAGGTSAAATQLQPPNTTINVGGGASGARLASSPGEAFGQLVASNNQQTAVLGQLHDKLTSMSPGDVVTVAASSTPSAFATGVTNATKSSASFSRALALTLQPS